MSPWLIRLTCRTSMETTLNPYSMDWFEGKQTPETPLMVKTMVYGVYGQDFPFPTHPLTYGSRILLPRTSCEPRGNPPNRASRLPGLILMNRFYKDVSHVELIIGESGLRPNPSASRRFWVRRAYYVGAPVHSKKWEASWRSICTVSIGNVSFHVFSKIT